MNHGAFVWFAYIDSRESTVKNTDEAYLAKYDEKIELIEAKYDYNPKTNVPNLELQLVWFTINEMGLDHTLIIDVIDLTNGNNTIASKEISNFGTHSTSSWRLNEIVLDNVILDLNSPLKGDSILRIGWRDPVSQLNLIAFDPRNQNWPENMAEIPIYLE